MGNPATNDPSETRGRWWPALACGLAGLVVFQFFGNSARGYIDTRSLFRWWGEQWIDPASECQHGWLILGVSLWLAWRNRPATASAGGGAGMAAASMLMGLAMHLLGYALQQTRLSIVGLLVFGFGWTVAAGGRSWGRAMIFPLGFLVFAIPLNVLDTLGFYLRLGIIGVSNRLAHGVGIAVIRNGTQLMSPDGRYSYDVAAACSGVNSLLALAALATLAGYVSFRRWPRRTLVALSCVPFAFLGNVLRIFLIVVAAAWKGQHAGQVVHDWFGFLIFLVVLGLVLALIGVIQNFWPEAAEERREKNGKSDLSPAKQTGWLSVVVIGVAAALVMLAAIRLDRMQLAPESGVILADNGIDPAPLPDAIGAGWVGHPAPVTEIERQVLPADTGFSRKSYGSTLDPAQWVLLSVVLSGKDRTSIHRPELCLVGQGWTIAGRSERDFPWPGGNGTKVRATVLRVERVVPTATGQNRRVPAVFVYWFVGAGREVPSSWERVWASSVDLLAHQRRHRWAYVFALTPLDADEADVFDRLQVIFNRALPVFEKAPGAGRVTSDE
ncbi:MAG TPA: exosortase/archaeosortase family protein [Candidatus Didemnitutus sp.]|nr:exosortase/archaeosortase family protein [Candidatus Didemnitutus sp.]